MSLVCELLAPSDGLLIKLTLQNKNGRLVLSQLARQLEGINRTCVRLILISSLK